MSTHQRYSLLQFKDSLQRATETCAGYVRAGFYRDAIDGAAEAFCALYFQWSVPPNSQLRMLCEKAPLSPRHSKITSPQKNISGRHAVRKALEMIGRNELQRISGFLRPWNERKVMLLDLHLANAFLLTRFGQVDIAFEEVAREAFCFPDNSRIDDLRNELKNIMRQRQTPLHRVLSDSAGVALAAVRARALMHGGYLEDAFVLSDCILAYVPLHPGARKIREGLLRWHPNRFTPARAYLGGGTLKSESAAASDLNHNGSRIFSFTNATIIGQSPIIVTADGRMIEESAPDGTHLGAVPELVEAAAQAGGAISAGDYLPLVSANAGNFHHWIAEQLPRAVIGQQAGFQGSYLVPLSGAFIAESLEMLGIARARLCLYDGNKGFSCERLVLVQPLSSTDFASLDGVYRLIRGQLLGAVKPEQKKRWVYVTGNRSRPVLNEEELLLLLSRYDFEFHNFESMPLAEQLQISSSAEVLMSAHADALTHCLFLPGQSHVVQLFSPSLISFPMVGINRMLKNHFHPIVASNPDRNYRHGDAIVAPLDLVELTLENIAATLIAANGKPDVRCEAV